MKRNLLFLSFFFLSFSAVKAQKISLGLELGSNIISVEESRLGNNFQFGPYTGVNVRYNITKNLTLSSGLFFSQRKKMYFSSDTSSILSAFDQLFAFSGISTNTDSLINIPGVDLSVYENTTGMATENYLEIPLMVTYNYKNFSIQAGPYLGFLMSGRRKEEIRTTAPILQAVDVASFDSTGLLSLFLPPADKTEFNESTTMTYYRKFDIGASFGIGYTMDDVKFKLNYTLGFKDYRIDRGNDSINRHSSVRLSVVYFFKLAKEADPTPSL